MNGYQSGKNSLCCWRNRISHTQKNSDRTSIIEGRSPGAVYLFYDFNPRKEKVHLLEQQSVM
ncbi:hypothetical protein IQ270_05465 [Microcoleus sp. LEGE 07076]|uniref:hypothetical protein n=1 Tax=Microcoleus sp. LEGE 07076 TaxID=915322 RepID=UPI00187F94BA|nr:hypothetical protein [Microcoleus sp. LEGE 07076]MBE9184183.1 hypothetical protein [Microcoleus sp. LEGE 07076]